MIEGRNLVPSIYKSGNLMYVCSPRLKPRNTRIRVYNITTGAFIRDLDAEGIVTGFCPSVQMTANAPWGSGVALCDAFVLQDEEQLWNRLQGINVSTQNWWLTDQWDFTA